MRDYKNVTVPKSYRSNTRRTAVKKMRVDRPFAQVNRTSGGLTRALLKLVIVVIIAAAGFLAWQGYGAVMHADLFVVSGVDIKGVKQLGERELKEIAGAFSGQNIFRVDLAAAVRRAQANPWVEEVRIHRRLPNRITMVFNERVAAYILESASGRYLMDRSGVITEKVAKESVDWQLPVIAIRGVRPAPGEPVRAESLSEAMQLIDDIAAHGGWRAAEITVKADTPDALTVMYAGHVFKMGSGRYDEKLRRLAEVMADMKDRGADIAYVDLRPERQAAVMIRR
jgi:cell division septal protein FtsQ